MAFRSLIYAVSPEGVIGVGGTIPWRYPADLKRFKRLTLGKTVVMGRATFDSIGHPLPGRRNLVVTSRAIDVSGVERVASIEEAIERAAGDDVWFIGGARIYADAMKHADSIDVTYVPDHVETRDAVRAPPIDPALFDAGPLLVHEDDPRLMRRVYTRRVVAHSSDAGF
jgi:dihydrofolate reductase